MSNPITPLNRRVLVVDDNPSIHEDFRNILCPEIESFPELARTRLALFDEISPETPRRSFEVDFATQGEEALARLRGSIESGNPYTVAFVDVQMPPGLDGVETTARLWEIQPDLEVVICTAHADYSWKEMVERLGHSDRLLILKKPFDSVEALQLAHALNTKWHLGQYAKRKIGALETAVMQSTSGLQENQEHFRFIVESASDLIVVIGAAGNGLYANPSFEKTLGVIPELVRAGGVFCRMHPEDRDIVFNAQRECFENGTSKVFLCRMLDHKDVWRQFECNINPANCLGTQFKQAVMVFRDVTERNPEYFVL